MVVPSAAADDYSVYSYNGYLFPPLPSVDRVAYPYAAITISSWGTKPLYNLLFSSTKFYFYEDHYKTIDEEKVPVLRYRMHIEDDGSSFNWWTLGPSSDNGSVGKLVWSDYDVLTDTESLYLAASEPVPFGVISGGDSGSSGDSSGGTDNPGSSGNSGTSGGSSENNYTSLLTSIISLLNTSNSNDTAIVSAIGDLWTRLYYIEDTTFGILDALSAFAPSAEETALKENVKDTTKEVTDSLFADDAPTKVTASDVKDVALIGAAASSMFDSGVSVGSFFDAFNNINLISLFTEKSKNELYAVNEVSTYMVDAGDSVVDYYTENLNKVMEFVGKGD